MLRDRLRFRRPALVLGLLSLLVNTGCYAYQPAAGNPHPGSGVKLQLTSEGTTELAKYLGPNVVEITGQLTDAPSSGILLVAPTWVKTSNGALQPWNGEGSVNIPRNFVRGLDERVFNKRQTIVATVAMVAGLVTLAVVALKAGGAHGSESSGGGQPTP